MNWPMDELTNVCHMMPMQATCIQHALPRAPLDLLVRSVQNDGVHIPAEHGVRPQHRPRLPHRCVPVQRKRIHLHHIHESPQSEESVSRSNNQHILMIKDGIANSSLPGAHRRLTHLHGALRGQEGAAPIGEVDHRDVFSEVLPDFLLDQLGIGLVE